MIPKDIVQQIANGSIDEWDALGAMEFVFSGRFTSPKGMKATTLYVNFEQGVVAFQLFPKDDNGEYDTIEERYAISAKLVPITENDEEPISE